MGRCTRRRYMALYAHLNKHYYYYYIYIYIYIYVTMPNHQSVRLL